jgi:MFS family permease
VLIGRLADRFGITAPMLLGAGFLSVGYAAAGLAPNIWLLAIAHGLIGIGSSATFGPLIADVSHWFEKRRGIAIAICASGNYLAGAIWPPIVQYFIATHGWRMTHVAVALLCLAALLPLTFALRRPSPMRSDGNAIDSAANVRREALGLSPNGLQVLLAVAGIACCVAMAMPQVHIVAYCADLGYGVARGAEMLSLMLAFGIVSRVGSGFIADRIGGVRTLLLGSVLQAAALTLYLMADGLASLYVISAVFGLSQGGIVPTYAVIVREYFPPQEAATRVGIALTATLAGMALGGWMSGAIFDLTGSYSAAFANGVLWNLLNIAVALRLVMQKPRQQRRPGGDDAKAFA